MLTISGEGFLVRIGAGKCCVNVQGVTHLVLNSISQSQDMNRLEVRCVDCTYQPSGNKRGPKHGHILVTIFPPRRVVALLERHDIPRPLPRRHRDPSDKIKQLISRDQRVFASTKHPRHRRIRVFHLNNLEIVDGAVGFVVCRLGGVDDLD